MSTAAHKYWIAAISKEHTERAVAGGFIQVNHGKEAPLRRMHAGDGIIIYSSKVSLESTVKIHSFTAIGNIIDDSVYQHIMTIDFKPFRRHVRFHKCAQISIIPLIDQLRFITNKSKWGYPFRFGFFEICVEDYNLIRSKMLIADDK